MNLSSLTPGASETVLVTGAGQRLGRALALSLARRGATLVLHYNRSQREAKSLFDLIGGKNDGHRIFQADLSLPEGQEQLIKDIKRNNVLLTGLVNNASRYEKTPLETLGREQWDEMLETNLTAPVYLAAQLGLDMKKRGRGSIVMVGDWSTNRPYLDYLAYSVSKGGLETATRALGRELAPAVRVNLLAPGPMLLPDNSGDDYAARVREAVPLRKIGGEDAYTKAVLFLLSNASYCTGSILTIDGGRHLT